MRAKTKVLYWTFTLLFIVPLAASGLGYLCALAPIVNGITHLGFPSYLVRFLGVAKLLGAAAILNERFPRLKEWAYAGFTFNLVGASYSHLCSGDGPKALLPLVILTFAGLSYHFWNKLASLRIAVSSFPDPRSTDGESTRSREARSPGINSTPDLSH